MSNLSTEVFGDMSYLYEHIANRDSQQLNENSDHYDEETLETIADILATISSSMVHEGYSASGIISFLSSSSEQDIIEKYLSFDENILNESVVSEDYIVEQLELFDFAISEGLESLVAKAGSFLGRVASKPARMKAAERLLKSNNPERTAAAYQKLANNNLNKLDLVPKSTDGAPASFRFKNTNDAALIASMSKPIAKIKDIARGAKAALTSPTARKIGLGALGAGALVALPYAGAKLAGAGSGQDASPSGAKPTDTSSQSRWNAASALGGQAAFKAGGGTAKMKQNPGMSAADVQKQGMINLRNKKPAATPPPAPALPAPSGSGGGGGGKPSGGGGGKPSTPAPAKPKKPATGTLGNTSFERRTPNEAEFKGAQEYRAANPNAKPEDVLKAAQEAGKRQASVDADIKKANAPAELNKPAPAGTALAAEQERRRKAEEEKNKQTVSSSYEYDAYDLVLEYLFDHGHADTLAEAEYLMTELDESFIQSLVENYEANLLADELQLWVNELVEEGYDLSEYTWDDMVDYYF